MLHDTTDAWARCASLLAQAAGCSWLYTVNPSQHRTLALRLRHASDAALIDLLPLLFQARMGLYDGGTSSGAERGAEGDGRALLDEAKSIYARLMQLDPLRRGYYQDALDGKAFVVVQALGTC